MYNYPSYIWHWPHHWIVHCTPSWCHHHCLAERCHLSSTCLLVTLSFYDQPVSHSALLNDLYTHIYTLSMVSTWTTLCFCYTFNMILNSMHDLSTAGHYTNPNLAPTMQVVQCPPALKQELHWTIHVTWPPHFNHLGIHVVQRTPQSIISMHW